MCQSKAKGGRRCASATAATTANKPTNPVTITHTQAGDTHILTAQHNNRNIAQLDYRIENDTLVIAWINVDPDQRGQGHATRLLTQAAQGRPVTTESATTEGQAWIDSLYTRTGLDITVDDPELETPDWLTDIWETK